ncbi:TonB family protein [Ruegeria conchae]|uniref:energy transducer TonB family protein n=1 Tax=Ruegeria conchae TaxID=981384 RepID=UPI00147DC2DB|nr:TonB family protein [Ruegeria conchae]UWR03043.1 TonB family protein [Ruegeria conchae]
MIRKSAAVAALAGALSLVLHILGISFYGPSLPQLRSKEESVSLIELGNTFEEFTEDTTDPVQPESAEPPEPPVEDTIRPDTADIPISETLVASPDPQQVSSPDVGAPVAPQSELQEGVPTEPVAPSSAEPAADAVTTATPPAPERLAALPPTDAPTAPVPPLESAAVEPEIPSSVDEPTTELPEEQTGASDQAVSVSKRPRLPDRRPATDTPRSLDGFSNFDNLRNPSRTVESPLSLYQKEGADPFRTSSGRNQSSGRGAGNSDTTNYAGQILVHLNQTPVVYVPVRGFAQVFFEINPDGSLAWVDIVDSSGSPEIERAARDQVIRAAPFPRPPSGSSRRLSFYYQNS